MTDRLYIPGSDVGGAGGVFRVSLVPGKLSGHPLNVSGITAGDLVVYAEEVPAPSGSAFPVDVTADAATPGDATVNFPNRNTDGTTGTGGGGAGKVRITWLDRTP